MRAYTVGYRSSQDYANAREASVIMGLPWTPIELDTSLLLREVEALLEHFPGLDPVTLSFELPLWILMGSSDEAVVLAGQGADELFGGYARYERLEGEALRITMTADLERLLTDTIPREERMAAIRGRELRLPYCDRQVVSAVLSLPPEKRLGSRRKEVLRRVAEALGLAGVLVNRPKKAAQYGSGVMKSLKAMARERGRPLGDFIEGLRPT